MRGQHTPLIVSECSRWRTVGVEGLILPRRMGEIADAIKIPAYDNGPLIEAIPTRAMATYTLLGGQWFCVALTATGTPTVREQGKHEVSSVGYTWSDVEAGLAMLPGEVADFVRRNQGSV